MERLACVNISYFALQLLLKREPAWRHKPVVVVDKDTAQGVVLEANSHARQFRIRSGMRYAAARSLARELEAGIVTEAEHQKACDLLEKELSCFSPEIEWGNTGIVWLRATGLDRLFSSFESWLEQLSNTLAEHNFIASIVLGFSKFGTEAIARTSYFQTTLLTSEKQERDTLQTITLETLALPHKTRDALEQLGVYSIGDLLKLPPTAIRKRFGQEAEQLWWDASGERVVPVQPKTLDIPVEITCRFDDVEWDANRMLFVIKTRLHDLFLKLAMRMQNLKELHLHFALEDGDTTIAKLRPARPHLEETRLTELIRLRLSNMRFPAGVTSVVIEAFGTPYHQDQVPLAFCVARRDKVATEHALSRIRAEFGDDAVTTIVLQDAHLPEQSFTLKPCDTLPDANPTEPILKQVIRRLYWKPKPIPRFAPIITPDMIVRSIDEEGVIKSYGPFNISGDWWSYWQHRDYYFLQTRAADLYWAFYDRRRKQWFLHGVVE